MYLVFAGDHYYPSGGWDDLVGIYNALDEAQAAANYGWHDRHMEGEVDHYGWYQIVDLDNKEVVERYVR